MAKDANNNVITDVLVSFSADSGALTPSQPTTDANGLALATIDSGTDPSNRTITVTATAGTATATVPVSVNGTSLALSGPGNLVLNNTGDYSVVLTNSSGQGIAGVPVTLASANGNTLTPASPNTDANGRMNFTRRPRRGRHRHHHRHGARIVANPVRGGQHPGLQHHRARGRHPGGSGHLARR